MPDSSYPPPFNGDVEPMLHKEPGDGRAVIYVIGVAIVTCLLAAVALMKAKTWSA